MKQSKLLNSPSFIAFIIIITLMMIFCINIFSINSNQLFWHDGDTFKMWNIQTNKLTTYRMLNVDCPELKQAYGSQSRDSVIACLRGCDVKIVEKGIDVHGRNLCIVLFNGRRLDSMIVANGWGYCYTSYLKDKWLIKVQVEAQNNKKGVWQHGGNIMPWEFRKLKK